MRVPAPMPWQPGTTALLPETAVLGDVAAVGAAVLGVAVARAITRDTDGPAIPRRRRDDDLADLPARPTPRSEKR